MYFDAYKRKRGLGRGLEGPRSVLPDTQSHAALGRRDGLVLAASPGSLLAQRVPKEQRTCT